MRIGANKYLRLYTEAKKPILGNDGVIFGLDGRACKSTLNGTVIRRVNSLQGVKPGFKPAYYSLERKEDRTEREILIKITY